MKPSFIRLLFATLLAAAVTSAVAQTPPAKPAPPAPAAEKAEKGEKAKKPARNRYPFHGTIKSCDAKAMTITLEGKEHERVLHLNGDSRLSKDGKDTTLSGLAAGDYFHGSVTKNERGDEVVLRAQAGPKPAPKAKDDDADKKPGKEKKEKKDK
jgi:hypothetical protein